MTGQVIHFKNPASVCHILKKLLSLSERLIPFINAAFKDTVFFNKSHLLEAQMLHCFGPISCRVVTRYSVAPRCSADTF